MIWNAFWQPLQFELPPARKDQPLQWRRWIDTSLESPDDIVSWEQAEPIPGSMYLAQPRSVVILASFLQQSNPRP